MTARELPLSRGMVALVDEADYDAVAAVGKWYANPCGRLFYARRNYWVQGRCHSLRMHSLITGWQYVDHRNGNGLDNRRANLRPADGASNAMNRSMRTDNTSGFKGVTRVSNSTAWAARLGLRGERYHLGVFPTAIDAALAYDAAAVEHFGEFARLNFPNQPKDQS
jgi:hypothetical protein